jgi:CspA family cold shock protein
MTGKVVWYNDVKRFGFIVGDNGNQYFMHKSNINNFDNVDEICEDQTCEFTEVETPKGLSAINVSLGD